MKQPTVSHSKACAALDSERRWLCSGTPINNDIMDLYGESVAWLGSIDWQTNCGRRAVGDMIAVPTALMLIQKTGRRICACSSAW